MAQAEILVTIDGLVGIEKTYVWIYDQYLAREKRLPHQA